MVWVGCRAPDRSAVVEIRDVVMERGTFSNQNCAEWRIRATVLSHSPTLQNGRAVVYLHFAFAGGDEASDRVGSPKAVYSEVWLSNGTGVFLVNACGPTNGTPTPEWTVAGYTVLAPATLAVSGQ
jgi:hypothetical protein